MPDPAVSPAPPAVRPRSRQAALTGPSRRFLLVVALLVTLASLPTLAGLGMGPARLRVAEPFGTTPFLAGPSAPPVVIVPDPLRAEPPVQA
ncbi:MAG TPA: hypothetical protein VNV66_12815, partial [Pilimelia sp.]|nr:hypothetical protein [Pilimelia sp.]